MQVHRAESRPRVAGRIRRLLDTLALALLSGMLLRAAQSWPTLPARIPLHFDAQGLPDGFGPRASFLMLPAIAVALSGLLWLVSAATRAAASGSGGLLNLPDKPRFLSLDPAGRMRALEPTRLFLAWTRLLLVALFLWIQEGVREVALGQRSGLPPWPVALFVVGLAAGLVPLSAATRAAIRAAAEPEAVPAGPGAGAGAEPGDRPGGAGPRRPPTDRP